MFNFEEQARCPGRRRWRRRLGWRLTLPLLRLGTTGSGLGGGARCDERALCARDSLVVPCLSLAGAP